MPIEYALVPFVPIVSGPTCMYSCRYRLISKGAGALGPISWYETLRCSRLVATLLSLLRSWCFHSRTADSCLRMVLLARPWARCIRGLGSSGDPGDWSSPAFGLQCSSSALANLATS